jgi:hypothetical protein
LGTNIINGIDTSVWPDKTFVNVIVSKETWEATNPSTLAKVLPAAMTHPGQWLEYARTTQVFTQEPKLIEDVLKKIATRDVVGS